MLYIFSKEEELLTILKNDNENSLSYDTPIHLEQLNGENNFKFYVPAIHEDVTYIKEFNLVAFKDLDNNYQLLEIKKVLDYKTLDEELREVFCEHTSLELLDDKIIKDLRPTNTTAHFALTQALQETRWEPGIVHDLGNNSTNFYYESTLAAVHKIAKVWKGELRFRVEIVDGKITRRLVDLLTRRGADTGKQFVCGKDIEEIEREVDVTEVYTALYGRGRGVELEEGSFGRRTTFADVEWKKANGDPVDKPLGQEWIADPEALQLWGRSSNRHRFGIFEDIDEDNPIVLLEKTWAALQQAKNPRITYRAKGTDLERITGLQHEKVRLGDTCRIIDKKFINSLLVSARIIEIERNLKQPEETYFTFGSFTPSLATQAIEQEQINRMVRDRARIWDENAEAGEFTGPVPTTWLDGVIDVLQNQLKGSGSYERAEVIPGKGLLFENNNEESIDFGALYIGPNILAIADSKFENGEWSWRSFGKGSGFTADAMNSGRLRTELVEIFGNSNFYWNGDYLVCLNPNNQNEQIRISKEGIRFTTNGGQDWGLAIGYDGIKMSGTSEDSSTYYTMNGVEVYDEYGFKVAHLGQYQNGKYGIQIVNGSIDADVNIGELKARELESQTGSIEKARNMVFDNSKGELFRYSSHLDSTKGLKANGIIRATIREKGEGKFGGGALATERATTNLINLDFLGWQMISGTREMLTDYGVKFVRTSTAFPRLVSQPLITVTPGEKVTFSCYIDEIKTSGTMQIQIHSNATGAPTNIARADNIPANFRGRFELTGIVPEGVTTACIWLRLNDANTASGDYFVIRKPQLERLPVATSFVVGSRPAGALGYDVSEGEPIWDGTICGWLQWDADKYDNTQFPYLFNFQTSDNQISILIQGSWASFRHVDGSSSSLNIDNSVFRNLNKGEWFFLALTWKREGNSFISTYLVKSRLGVRKHTRTVAMFNEPRILHVGNYANVSSTTTGLLMNEVLFLRQAVDDATLEFWHDMNKPLNDPLEIDGHNANESPHNLPSYTKMQSDGIKVFDASNVKRVHLGQYAAGKYGLEITNGEIYSTTIRSGAKGAASYTEIGAGWSPLKIVHNNGTRLDIWADGGRGMIQLYDTNDMRGQIVPHNDMHGIGIRIHARTNSGSSQNISLMGANIEIAGHVWVADNFRVYGTKNAVVLTDNYGDRLMYSMEMPELKFEDEGFGELVEGICRIDIDPIFLDTIEPNSEQTPFMVHLTPYDWIQIRVKEIGNSYFIVEEKEGLSGRFAWRMSATRKGYAGVRLERIDDTSVIEEEWENEIIEEMLDKVLEDWEEEVIDEFGLEEVDDNE